MNSTFSLFVSIFLLASVAQAGATGPAEQPPDLEAAQTVSAEKALVLAVKNGRVEIVEEFLEAVVNEEPHASWYGDSMLQMAMENGQAGIVKLLLRYAQEWQQLRLLIFDTGSSEHFLNLAVKLGFVDVVSALLDAAKHWEFLREGMFPAPGQPACRRQRVPVPRPTALHLAAQAYQAEIVALLGRTRQYFGVLDHQLMPRNPPAGATPELLAQRRQTWRELVLYFPELATNLAANRPVELEDMGRLERAVAGFDVVQMHQLLTEGLQIEPDLLREMLEDRMAQDEQRADLRQRLFAHTTDNADLRRQFAANPEALETLRVIDHVWQGVWRRSGLNFLERVPAGGAAAYIFTALIAREISGRFP